MRNYSLCVGTACLSLASSLLANPEPAPTPLSAPQIKDITPEMKAEMERKFDEPSPDSLPLPDDPNLAKISFLRIWYLGGPGSPRISLALEESDKKQTAPRLIDSRLMAGNVIASYGLEVPGSYTLHVLDGTVGRPTDPKSPLPLDKKLAEPHRFTLNPGAYTTVVIRPDGGKFKIEEIEQKPLAKEAASQLRVQNFSTLDGWSIRFGDSSGKEREIWTPAQGTGALLQNLPQSGRGKINVYMTKEGSTRLVDTFAWVPASGQSHSIVLHDGLGGWGGFQYVVDAHPGSAYNAELVKALAGQVH